jgi:4-amino-4-deoxy-L-arabinose transferase-like glycosyltransferase
VILRLYFFSLTQNQPLWWDEGEYGLKAKSLVFDTPLTGWFGAREIIVPAFWGILFYIHNNEFFPRLFQAIISIITVYLTYLVGEKLYNKRTGLIASLIMSVNAIHLFFTSRLLTYLWAPFFLLLIYYFFAMYSIKKAGKKYLYYAAISSAIGISIYGSVAFGVAAIFLFFIITEQHKIFLKKEIWVALLLGTLFMAPQLIYNQVNYGSFASRFTALVIETAKTYTPSYLFSYVKMFPHLFGIIFSVIIALGFAYILVNIFISADLLVKNKEGDYRSDLLMLLWALIIFGFYTYVAVFYITVYDAFLLSAFPAFAIVAARGAALIYSFPFKRKIMTFILIAILAFGAYYSIIYANSIIRGKLTSFDSVKSAGEWIKENSNPGDIVISSSLPQMTYYSERVTYPYLRGTPVSDDPTIRTTEEDFDKFVNEKKPKFITDSIWEQVPPWVHQYAQKHNDTLIPVQAYFADPQKTQLTLVVYQVQYS